MILGASALPVYFRCRVHLRQDRLLAAFADTLTFSAERIGSDLTALPVLAADLEQNGPIALRSFWKQFRQGLEQGGDEPDVLWRASLSATGLHREEIGILEAYPGILRSYDVERVKRELLRMRAELESHRRELRQRFQRNFKAQTGVQISAALLLLILLL